MAKRLLYASVKPTQMTWAQQEEEAMAKPKSITIKLTETQRTQLRKLTGQDHKSVRFDAVTSRSGRSALGRIAAPSVVGGTQTPTTAGAYGSAATSAGMDPTTLGGKSALSGKGIVVGRLVDLPGSSTPPSSGMDPTK